VPAGLGVGAAMGRALEVKSGWVPRAWGEVGEAEAVGRRRMSPVGSQTSRFPWRRRSSR
jgi:hypothetical protein